MCKDDFRRERTWDKLSMWIPVASPGIALPWQWDEMGGWDWDWCSFGDYHNLFLQLLIAVYDKAVIAQRPCHHSAT